MAKIYHVVITSIDEDTKEQTEEVNEEYSGLTLMGTCGEHGSHEVILHDNLMNMACKLASWETTRKAVMLAHAILQRKEERVADLENILADSIGGMQ